MSQNKDEYIKGRGSQMNPNNRFSSTKKVIEHWEGIDELENSGHKTKFIEIYPKTVVNKITSPDIGLEYSMNPYQGCEHGCTYCYARPTHEYWGYSAGIEFENTILVKKNAAELLEKAFRKKTWEVNTIMLSGNTDCYQPCEKKFGITRQLLEVCLKYKHPVGIITKNILLERDFDIIEELSKLNLINVNISLTTLNEELRRRLEPRTASAAKKLELIEKLSRINVPVNVMMAPILPGLNDTEIFNIVKAVSQRGALSAHYQIVRLNGPNQQIFSDWIQKNYPDRADKVLNQLRDMHGSQLNSSEFGQRMSGKGNFALNIKRQFALAKKMFLSDKRMPTLRKDIFQAPDYNGQMSLF